MAAIQRLFEEFQHMKMMSEKQIEEVEENAKVVESTKAIIMEQLSEADEEEDAIGKTMRKGEAERGHLGSEEDKWRDIRAGTLDEMESESTNFFKLQNDYNSQSHVSSTTIFEDAKRAKEMHFFYNATRCTERIPEFRLQIVSKQKDLGDYLKRLESLQNKCVDLSLKKEVQRGTENNFPNENVKQFVLKEGRKQRQGIAKEVAQARAQFTLMQLDTDESEVQGPDQSDSPVLLD